MYSELKDAKFVLLVLLRGILFWCSVCYLGQPIARIATLCQLSYNWQREVQNCLILFVNLAHFIIS